MPGATAHPQPCVQMKKARKQVTTVTPEHPAFPHANGLTAYSALSPVIGFVDTVGVMYKHDRRMPASRHQDHAASPYASPPFVVRRPAPTASRPNVS
jgi:hypothetical protein